MIKPLLIALSAILVSPNFVDKDIQSNKVSYNGIEKFSPQLSYINSIDKLEKFVDETASDKNIPIGSLAYTEVLENIVAHRFHNGFSHKTLSQDWITVISDRIAGTHYSRLVTPDEIIQHPNAASSQQAIVMMEVLQRKKIPFREVHFSRHTALEVFVNAGWYLLDANMEPNINGNQRLHENWYGHADQLKKYYTPVSQPELSALVGTGSMAAPNKPNEKQHSTLIKLQAATGILSKILWLFPLGLVVAYRRRPFKMYALKPIGKYVRMQPLRPVYNT